MTSKSEAVNLLYTSGYKTSQILAKLKPTISKSGVYKIINRIRITETYLPKVRKTPPRPVKTPNLVKCIREKIKRRPKKSVGKLAQKADVSRGTMQNLVKNGLKMKALKCQTPSCYLNL